MATAPATVSMRRIREEQRTPKAWREWLNRPEAIAIFGAGAVRSESKRLDKLRRRAATDVSSATWLDAYDAGHQFPPGPDDPKTPHGIRMVMSVVSGRYTPPQCLGMEDFLDGMGICEAVFYDHPQSPSALAIIRIEQARAKPIGGEW